MKMKIGAMNNPKRDIYEEIRFIAEHFDFLDLTIEPGSSYSENIKVKKIHELKKKHNLKIIGHTPWDLPFSSPYKSIREAAFQEYMKCIEVFAKLEVSLVNVHPWIPEDISDPNEILNQNIEFFKKASSSSKKKGIAIMMENTRSIFNEIEVIASILEEVPLLKLHWDVGHANLGNEGEQKTEEAFRIFRDRIAHVHFSDNNGREDLHLPLGAGNINWSVIMGILVKSKYSSTITLEVHSPDRNYLLYSRDRVKHLVKELKGGKK